MRNSIVRGQWVSSLALAIGVATSAQASAQEIAALDADDNYIVVTGSRLVRDGNATSPAPVTTVSAADMLASGNSDPTATIRQIPALISSGTVADSIERGGGGLGQATLNLRQLGSNRTLVLIDGHRHVSGVAGAQTVDVSTVPSALIERVEVLTGGASAVYGADAVTGVVNYVLREDFEGLDLGGQASIAGAGAGGGYSFDMVYGKNFADGRGNLTFSAGYAKDHEVLMGQRHFTRNNGRANNSTTYSHPDRRFQAGDINPSTMPNFASYYSQAEGRFPLGYAIPQLGSGTYSNIFGSGAPTAAEQALIDRAKTAPLFMIARDPRFAISSAEGLVFRNDFGFFNADINGNGINDCEESYIGLTGFGGGGCYITTADGGVKIYEDGIVSTSQNQFGGDGAVERTNTTSLIPKSERYFANLRGRYDLGSDTAFFFDAKYTRNESMSRNNYNTFYDSLLIFPDNPFIPDVLQADADEAGGLRVSRDFLDLGPNKTTAKRETYRLVAGFEGELTDRLSFELVGNYGRTDNAVTVGNSVRYDRLFAAIDVIEGPNGQAICRSDIDDTPYPGSEIFPVIAPGFFTFTPGDGQCKPANIMAGSNSVSQEAAEFITTPTTSRYRIEQLVFSGFLSGDTGGFFTLPGGPISFVLGAEYRKEKSRSRFDAWDLGLLPANSPAGPQGTFIGDVSDNQSLIFDAATRLYNTGGSFDVKEVFGELLIPVLKDEPFFHELTVGLAGRFADYSTIGGGFTWNANAIWAPMPDLRFRGGYSQAIRAPNIGELFNPAQGTTFRPADPCDANNQNATPNRLANCIAAAEALGIPNAAAFISNYSDPLTARFSGTSGGNPNLKEETATTWTVGAVLQPSFLPRLTLSADYYSIKIEDAIAAVAAQDIVNTCYDITTFPNQFCDLFDRKGPSAGQTSFGFEFLRQTQLNFGRIETSGIDFTADYRFSLGKNNFGLRLTGNWTEKVNRFFDPVDTSLVNPGLMETGAPEWAGVGSATYQRGIVSLNYSVQYIGKQAIASAIEIERIDEEFGAAGYAQEYWVHNLAASLEVGRNLTITGGVNNLTDKEPYLASSAYPVSGVGRLFFLGARARF